MAECTCELILTVEEPDEIELSYVEAEIKPEQTKNVVPAETPQTVEPDPGFTLGAVNVDAIPPEYIKPAGKIIFTENVIGADIKQYAEAEVAVPAPTLQQKTATPTELEQTVEADSGYDGLSRVTVNRIPQEYIVPSGKIELTQNATDVDGSQYAAADIAVPVPVMPEEYCIGGSLAERSLTEYVIDPNSTATALITSMFVDCRKLVRVRNIPSTLTTMGDSAFRNCVTLEDIGELPNGIGYIGVSAFAEDAKLILRKLPSSLKTILGNAFWNCMAVLFNEMPASVTTIGATAFRNCTGITSMTFKGTPTSIANNAFYVCSNLRNIYVPWSEGEVANAPWGATNATITYDYTGG